MRKFLLSLSGTRSEILEQRPRERGTFEALGLTVLMISGIAAVSVWFALTSGLALNPLVAIAPALAGGLIVMGIERWLVTSVPSGGPRRRLKWAIPRLALALLLGAVISTPILLRIFQPQINHQITLAKQSQQDAFKDQQTIAAIQVFRLQLTVANLQRVVTTAGKVSLDPATDPQVVVLTGQRATQLALEKKYDQQLQCQLYGEPGCAAGAGPGSKQSGASYQQASAQVTMLTQEIEQREALLAATDSAQARYQSASASLPAFQRQLVAAQAQQKQQNAAIQAANNATPGLATKLNVLRGLGGNDAAVGAAVFLTFLLFLIVTCAPVTVRVLMQPAGYGGLMLAVPVRERSRPPRTPRGRHEATAASSVAPPPEAELDSLAAQPDPEAQRYLKAQCPESVAVGKPFSLLARIVSSGPARAILKPFDVPPQGRDVLLVVHAPRLRLLGDQRLTAHVPAEGDSEPVMFELRADEPGPRSVSITAWVGGSYLGELLLEITAERDRRPGPHREAFAEIAAEPTEGAVALVVRYDPGQQAYRFEFRDEDNPDEVTSHLAYDPKPVVERLITSLDDLAKGRTGYSPAQARDYLLNKGAELWDELLPEPLRRQFWERQHRIRQLTILADRDTVPWELLYPLDPDHDEGFLVEQFPVTRAVFKRRLPRTLSLWPARFVLPMDSLPEAQGEIDAMRQLLDPTQPPGTVISALTPLQDLINRGDFGLLHFACHNRFDPDDGSSIMLDHAQFTPTLLKKAAIGQVLARSAPTVFINACRSAGKSPTYNRLDGWASKFLEAGAGAFIGSLWSVTDGTAREFAEELYRQLQGGSLLGEAVMRARQAAASQLDDPTWLAYAVYGNPLAAVSARRMP
jgi:hypothetical protein